MLQFHWWRKRNQNKLKSSARQGVACKPRGRLLEWNSWKSESQGAAMTFRSLHAGDFAGTVLLGAQLGVEQA
jgi:hypothetical protein